MADPRLQKNAMDDVLAYVQYLCTEGLGQSDAAATAFGRELQKEWIRELHQQQPAAINHGESRPTLERRTSLVGAETPEDEPLDDDDPDLQLADEDIKSATTAVVVGLRGSTRRNFVHLKHCMANIGSQAYLIADLTFFLPPSKQPPLRLPVLQSRPPAKIKATCTKTKPKRKV